jgi:N-acetylglutamate synthase-like GNAT family acetyltransferase
MCSLRVNDGIREDLSPWLGSLVVHPEYQRQGIAVKLIDAIKQTAKSLNYKELFLLTFDPTLPEYYAKLGWIDIGIDNFQNKKVTLMKVML